MRTPAEFALAMFVGLSLYMCIGNTLTSAPSLVLGNAGYVKTLSFPVEILSVSSYLNLLANLLIGLALCVLGFLLIHGFIHWTAIFLIPLIISIGLISLGLSWVLSESWCFRPGPTFCHVAHQHHADVHEWGILSDLGRPA